VTTTFKLTSPATQAAAPFSLGLGFKKGDIPSSLATDLTNYQVVVKRRWNDNSVKHAIVTGRAALTANVPLTVTASPGTPPAGTALTAASIATAAPSASVQCGSLSTVNLSSLLASPFRTWISGPEMVEAHYRASVGSTLLSVWFHVRLYADGRKWVRAVVENGYLDNGSGAVAANADSSYVPTVIIGGVTVYNNGGASLTHCRNTRWTAEGWIGTDPQVLPQQDVAYLRSSKLVPNYAWSDPSSDALNVLGQTYAPMDNGDIPAGMANPGGSSAIALLPDWNAKYLGNGDARAYRATLANSSSLNSFGICWRDFTTKTVLKPSAFANWSVYGPGEGGGRNVDLSNGTSWEINHHPGEGYLAYLLTGDYWHYETMQLQATFLYILRGSSSTGVVTHGNGVNRIIVHETRGTAWSIRSLSQAVGLAPDEELAAGQVMAEYRTLLANNMLYWKAKADDPAINGLGLLYEYSVSSYGSGWVAPWQQFWIIQSQGFGSDIEPLADMSAYLAVRDHMYQMIVGMLGNGTGFCYATASIYNMKITDVISADPTTWYDSWSEVAASTFAHLSGGAASIVCGSSLLNGGDMAQGQPVPATGGSGDPADATYGRWGYLLPAIAYAAEHGATGAADSWARITGASNYATLRNAGFENNSQWGVIPREISEGVPVMPITGARTRADTSSLITGKTVAGNRGLGVLGSSVPSTGTHGPAALYEGLTSDELAAEVRAVITVQPLHGTLFMDEDSSFTYTRTDGQTGADSYTIEKFVAGVSQGTAVKSTQIGASAPTVSGVTVSPSTAAVAGAATQQFTATVAGTNSPSQSVTWTTSAGSISSSGLFTAPAATSSSQTITVTATSTANTAFSGTASVTVAAVGSTVSGVSITPATATKTGGTTQQFTATVAGTNSPSQNVTWSTTAGSISSSGLFTAPAASSSIQTVTITATSVQNTARSGTAVVTVPAAVVVTPVVTAVVVTPSTATLSGGATQQFTATVAGTNSPSQSVTWAVSGSASISSSGLLTVPAATTSVQTFTVTATSVANTSISDTSLAQVVAVGATVYSQTPSIYLAEVPTDGTTGVLDVFYKQPAEVMDYDVSFSAWLAAIEDTEGAVVVTAEEGITLLDYVLSDGVVKVWLGSGTDLEKYKVTLRMTTGGNRVKEVEIAIKVKDT
jgi:hypothetical protein